jgi:hypothetical protein
MVRFRPSTKPASANPLSSPLTMNSDPAAVESRRNPTTGIAGCCACAANGHATAALPSSVMNARRSLSSMALPSGGAALAGRRRKCAGAQAGMYTHRSVTTRIRTE